MIEEKRKLSIYFFISLFLRRTMCGEQELSDEEIVIIEPSDCGGCPVTAPPNFVPSDQGFFQLTGPPAPWSGCRSFHKMVGTSVTHIREGSRYTHRRIMR